ncbi:MAG: C40 family peptidase, partial [Candidatus Geothermincolia bacterium]
QQRVEDAVEQYKSACDRLDQTKEFISENSDKITAAEEELAARQASLNRRARAMYVSRSTRFVDVVVSSANLDQFLVGVELLKRVGKNDATLVRGVKDAKAQLQARRQELQAQKDEQESARQEMASSKANVEAALQQSKGKLAAVEGEIRQALARQAAAASGSRSVASRVPYPVIRNTMPPGTPHPGVVNIAYDQLGKPYVWGATGPNSFDCSGLTTYCYRYGAGIEIPRSSYDQANCGASLGVSQLQPGDILGFRGWGHVGLYIGNDQFIHAPSSGDVVKITALSSRGNFCGATRP